MVTWKTWETNKLTQTPITNNPTNTMAVPGEAFGAAEAGASPSKTGQPPAVESAVSKALRGAGFPDVESKVVPSAAVNKITSGIQKRMIKMDELLNKLGDAPKTSLGDKILWLPFFENQKSFNFSMLRNSLSNSTRIYHDVLPPISYCFHIFHHHIFHHPTVSRSSIFSIFPGGPFLAFEDGAEAPGHQDLHWETLG